MFETTPREIFDLSPTRDGTITLADIGVDRACQGTTPTLGTCSIVDQIRQVEARHHVKDRLAMGRKLRHAGARSGGVPPTPRTPSPPRLSKASERAVRSANTLQSRDGISDSAVAILFDPTSGYMAIAEALVKSQRRHLSRGHVLCESLNATAEACDPATYTLDLKPGIEKLLLDAGMKPWIARVLAATSLTTMLAAACDPTAQLRLTLRSLIMLTCPNLELCPAIDDVSKAFLASLVADELRAGAAALWPRS